MLVLNKETTRNFPQLPGDNPVVSDGNDLSLCESGRPEALLIFACARTAVDAATALRMRTLLSRDLNWSLVFEKAQQNCVMPLLCRNLMSVGPPALPENVMTELVVFLSAHARRNLHQSAALITVLRLFEENRIPALPFKGPILATRIYGDLSLRQFGDLDILVPQRHLTQAIELLISQGYERASADSQSGKLSAAEMRRKDLVLTSADGVVRIELHWRLSGTHFSFPLDLNRLWEHLHKIPFAGADVRCLAPNELLLYLCVHGSRHGWERLGWICDVAELLRMHPDLEWSGVIAQARLLGCERALALGLLLAVDLLDAKMPPAIRRKLPDDTGLRITARRVREWLFRERSESLKLSDWYLYHLDMKERPRDKARLHFHYYARYLRLALKPNRKDQTLVLLPPAWSFLYYLLRPLRLSTERLTNGARGIVRGLR